MIRIGEPAEKATRAAVEAVERALEAKLPADYATFLEKHNGAEPETNIFRIDDSNDSGVNGFIPVAQLMIERELIEQELPSTAVPIAWAEGGNFVCLDIESGTVFFWDHEDPASRTFLANGFSEFLEILRPFDVADVKLRPDQVKSVWVDPSLFE